MKLKMLSLLVACLFLVPCCKKSNEEIVINIPPLPLEDELKEYVPIEYQGAVLKTFTMAGDNKYELIKVLKAVKPEERKGASFIIATMSFPDMASIKSEVLLEHIKYAYLAKGKYPWLKSMPEEIFMYGVLPYRCAEEPIEAYRRYFYEQLDPVVSGLTKMSDVVHQVNLWLGAPKADGKQRVRFVPTEARDQGPIETLKAGYGRCEEMMIVYMSAARSVGIPCRSAWTNWWAVNDNNHAWVEVWVDGVWRPVGGCEPSLHPWFENTTKRAPAIFSAIFGTTKSEPIYRAFPINEPFKTNSIINSTPNYSQTCELKVTVLSPTGEKVSSGTGVSLAVYNWGAFKPFMRQETDKDGTVSFVTGIGEYFLSAGKDKLRAWQVIKTEPDKKLEFIVKLSENSAPDGFVFLRYPTEAEAAASFNPEERYPNLEITYKVPFTPAYQAPAEIYTADEFDPAKFPELDKLVPISATRAVVIDRLKKAGGNWGEIASAIKEAKPEMREDLCWLIAHLVHLETLEVTKGFLLENVSYANTARAKAPYPVSDELFQSYVLSPLFTYIHPGIWRAELYDIFSPMMQKTITDTARTVNDWVAANIKVRDERTERFSYQARPMEIYKSRGGPAYSIAVMTAAILRTLAIPVQVKSDWVEFHNGTEWIPLYPNDPKNFGNTKRNEASQKEYIKPAGFKIVLINKGVRDANIWEKFRLSKFDAGFWLPMEDEVERKGSWMVVPPGQYLLTAGIRDSNGDPYVYCKQLDLESEKGVEMEVSLDIPINLLSGAERVVRNLPKLPAIELNDLDNQPYNLKKTLETNNVLLVFFSLKNEPSLRMMPMIDGVSSIAQKAGTVIWGIYVDPEGADKFLEDGRLKGMQMPVLVDSTQAVLKQFIPDFTKDKAAVMLPSTVLISKKGEIVMWREGYNMDIAHVVESALTLLPEGKPLAGEAGEAEMPKMKIVPFEVSGVDYIKEGDKNYKEGKYQAAIECYLKALEDDNDPGLWYNLACTYSLVNQVDEALGALKKAIQFGYSEWTWMDNDPDLENIRKDPRYKELRK
ncbi:MAG: redoxin domain-containing protein [Planctomycetes bacterium]|nr:redoxin domain-containing protein [Planctomycetota bacterium]